jgi:hypothetical protein
MTDKKSSFQHLSLCSKNNLNLPMKLQKFATNGSGCFGVTNRAFDNQSDPFPVVRLVTVLSSRTTQKSSSPMRLKAYIATTQKHKSMVML